MSEIDFEKAADDDYRELASDSEGDRAAFVRVVAAARREAYEAGAKAARHAVVVKLCNEHVHEDDLIAWLKAEPAAPPATAMEQPKDSRMEMPIFGRMKIAQPEPARGPLTLEERARKALDATVDGEVDHVAQLARDFAREALLAEINRYCLSERECEEIIERAISAAEKGEVPR